MLTSLAQPVLGGDSESMADKPATSRLDLSSINVEEQFLMTTSSDIPDDDGFVRSLIEIIPEREKGIRQRPDDPPSDHRSNYMNSSSGAGSTMQDNALQGGRLEAPQAGTSQLEDKVRKCLWNLVWVTYIYHVSLTPWEKLNILKSKSWIIKIFHSYLFL